MIHLFVKRSKVKLRSQFHLLLSNFELANPTICVMLFALTSPSPSHANSTPYSRRHANLHLKRREDFLLRYSLSIYIVFYVTLRAMLYLSVGRGMFCLCFSLAWFLWFLLKFSANFVFLCWMLLKFVWHGVVYAFRLVLHVFGLCWCIWHNHTKVMSKLFFTYFYFVLFLVAFCMFHFVSACIYCSIYMCFKWACL